MRTLGWILLLSSVCFAQELKVRVLNAKNRQPLARETISIQYLGEKPPSASSPIRLQTDDHGEARFSLPNPIPETVNVKVSLTSEHWHCSCWVMAETAKLLHDGIVQPAQIKSAKNTETIKSDPGEVVILARPFTLGERLLYPFVKQ